MKLLTTQETADRLRIGKQAVLRLLRKAELRGYKTGKLWLVDEADIDAYLAAGANVQATDRRRRRRVT